MKTLIVLFCLLGVQFSSACNCYEPDIALEFLESNYVFEGKVISKEYSEDYLMYRVRFLVLKHYKNGENPKYIEFSLKSESEYTDVVTSCDWSVKENQKWLVFSKTNNGEAHFNYYCSNSTLIDNQEISHQKQKVLDNGNLFEVGGFIYENQQSFNFTKPVTNIDEVFKNGSKENFKETFLVLKLFIDKNGELINVATKRNVKVNKDSIFDLPTNFELLKDVTLTAFEKEAVRLVNRIKKWEVKYYNNEIPVSYIRSLIVEYDVKSRCWSYEL